MEYLTPDNISFRYIHSGIYNSKGKAADLGGVSNNAVKQVYTVKWKFYVIDMITKGTAKIKINGRWYYYEPGDVSIRKPNDITEQDPYSDYECMCFHIQITAANDHTVPAPDKYGCILNSLPPKLRPFNLDALLKTAADMQRYLSAYTECGEYFKKLTALHFIAELCRNVTPEGLPKNNKYNQKMSKAIAYIENNLYFEHIPVEKLAAVAGLSPKHFQKVFKEATGKTPAKFLYDRRMEQAMLHVRDTNETIAEISDMFGFSNNSYFAKCFKKYYGKSPLDFRKST